MIYKKRNIGGGDPIYKFDGTELIIHSWSPNTGDVYAKEPDGSHINITDMEDQLSWNPPFRTNRTQKEETQ